LFDGSLQGLQFSDFPAFGFQGHPEASPGPHDILGLFDHFIDLMKEKGNALIPPSVPQRRNSLVGEK
jgi:carbamoyl-phosphate synthase small subunit